MDRARKAYIYIFLIFLQTFLFVKSGYALTPEEIVVVANKNGWHSINLGKYYMRARGIPQDNIIRLLTTDNETVSREDYERQIAGPIKKFILGKQEQGKEIHCLVLMYGMPLRILPPELTREEIKRLKALEADQARLQEILEDFDRNASEYKKFSDQLKINKIDIETINSSRESKGASLDSELSLVLNPPYDLEKWIKNPLFLPYKNRLSFLDYKKVLLVSRLDGPDETVVKRIIDDSVKTEQKGLQGTAYFDARWQAPSSDKIGKLQGYGYYDWSIHQAAAYFKNQNIMPVVLDEKQELFQPGDAPNAAIYCGWYSLSRYVDAFKWQPGAVGFHIASGECVSLKKNSGQWCRNILEKGAAATLGPVGEPYVQAFPIPELFFKLLADGRFTLVESYYLSLPELSWKMILIGDPLYRPFMKRSLSLDE